VIVKATQTYIALSCDTDGAWRENYRFGFNGQQKDNEVAGIGNHNTALFWEYDTRLGRRWNMDPVVDPSVSLYNVFKGNPIKFADPLGDVIKTNKEGNGVIQEGLTATLGKDNANNPIGYDETKGQLTFNKDFDRSKFNDRQLELIDRYGQLINSEVDEVNFKVVNQDEKLPELKVDGQPQSLKDLNAAGITSGGYYKADGKITGSQWNVFVARSAVKREPFSLSNTRIVERQEPGWYRGLVTIHELGGHTFLKVFHPELSREQNRRGTKEFEERMRKIYTNPDTGKPVKGYSNEDGE
jgi:RHS repeat-associated protein